jgi:hypothetical protein
MKKKTDSQLTKRLRNDGCEDSFIELSERYKMSITKSAKNTNTPYKT